MNFKLVKASEIAKIKSTDKGLISVIILLDYNLTFDTVNHKILVSTHNFLVFSVLFPSFYQIEHREVHIEADIFETTAFFLYTFQLLSYI